MLIKEMKKSTYSLVVLCTLLLLISTACNSATTNTSPRTTTTVKLPSPSTPASTTSTLVSSVDQTAQLTTACPQTGSGRAAVMPQLSLPKNHQNIVFFTNTATTGALKRYDILTKVTTTILTLATPIETAQLSQDGHWILFTTAGQNISTQLQLIRIDGKELQTLYCSPARQPIDPSNTTGVQWSPDLKQIIFAQSQGAKSSTTNVDQLQLSNGSVRTLLSSYQYQPKTWLDDHKVYVTAANGSSLFVLDTTKSVGQNLQLVIGVHDTAWNFDSDYNATTLFVTNYDDTIGRAGPGTYCKITATPINGGNTTTVFNKNNVVFSDLRVAGYSSTTLLLRVNERAAGLDQYNGIWRVQRDGTGLKQLTNIPGPFNTFTQYPWSNVSQDGAYYLDYQGYGSLSGGPLTTYTSNGIPIGWAAL